MVFLRGYEGFILLQFVYCILCHSAYILFYICCIFEMFLQLFPSQVSPL